MTKRNLLFALFASIIIFLSLFARMYRLPYRYEFGGDEEYQDTYARTLYQDFHPVWIGMNVGDTGAYHGPYFIYFTAFWLWISRGDPLITAYVAAIIGVLTTISLLYIVNIWLGKRIALITSYLYALSPLMVYFDQKYWNPLPIPLIFLWLIFALSQLSKSGAWLLMISLCLGVVLNTHFSLLILFPLVLWVIYQYRLKIEVKWWLFSVVIFLSLTFPLVVFDYYHNFSNILTPLRMLQGSGNTNLHPLTNLSKLLEAFIRWFYLMPGLSNTVEILAACRSQATRISPLLSALSAIPISIFLWFSFKNSHSTRLCSFAVIILICGFVFYPRSVSEYYALGLAPFFFLVVAYFVKHLPFKLSIFTLILYATYSSLTIYRVDESYGLAAKKKLIAHVSQNLTEPYYLDETGIGCHRYGGWRYLFSVYGTRPTASSTDASLGWLYPSEIQSRPSTTISVAENLTPNYSTIDPATQFGGFIVNISSSAYNK